MIPAAAIVTECDRRGYTPPQKTLAVLCLALNEKWDAIPPGFFDQFDATPHPTGDAFYDLAQLRELPDTKWQEFKMRLYAQLPAALPFTLGPNPDDEGDDLLSALTPDEQRQLFNNIAVIAKALPAIASDVSEVRAQTCSPSRVDTRTADWPSLGKNDKGLELTPRDAFGVERTDVAAIKADVAAIKKVVVK